MGKMLLRCLRALLSEFKLGLEKLGMQLQDSTRHTLRKMIDTEGTKKITYTQWDAFMNVADGPFDKRRKTPTNASSKKLRGMSNPNTASPMMPMSHQR